MIKPSSNGAHWIKGFDQSYPNGPGHRAPARQQPALAGRTCEDMALCQTSLTRILHIAQDVARISPRHTVADLIRRDQDLECSVFAPAIRSQMENRVLAYNNKPVVFD